MSHTKYTITFGGDDGKLDTNGWVAAPDSGREVVGIFPFLKLPAELRIAVYDELLWAYRSLPQVRKIHERSQMPPHLPQPPDECSDPDTHKLLKGMAALSTANWEIRSQFWPMLRSLTVTMVNGSPLLPRSKLHWATDHTRCLCVQELPHRFSFLRISNLEKRFSPQAPCASNLLQALVIDLSIEGTQEFFTNIADTIAELIPFHPNLKKFSLRIHLRSRLWQWEKRNSTVYDGFLTPLHTSIDAVQDALEDLQVDHHSAPLQWTIWLSATMPQDHADRAYLYPQGVNKLFLGRGDRWDYTIPSYHTMRSHVQPLSAWRWSCQKWNPWACPKLEVRHVDRPARLTCRCIEEHAWRRGFRSNLVADIIEWIT